MKGAEKDLFLSYSSADRAVVDEIRARLEVLGVRTFFDRSDLSPGQPWPHELEQALASCRAVAVFVGARPELGTWQLRETWAALDRQARAQGRRESFPVVPVLLPGADARTGFLFLNTWIDLRKATDRAEGIDRLVRLARDPAREGDFAEAELPDICPYRGLEPFRRQDEPFFFGREAFSEELERKTLAHRLVTVVGASGSGKSSVVQAGLLPRLGRHPEGRAWETATFRPGDRPFHALALALAPLRWPELEDLAVEEKAQRLGDQLAAGTSRIEVQVEKLLEVSNGSTALLLVIDQFEEIFRETPEAQRRRFIDSLLAAIDRSRRVRVLLTLRADFYPQVLETSRSLGGRLAACQVNLGPMTPEELESVVRRPAKRAHLRFESELLIEDLLRDAGAGKGSLALLEFCLQELYRVRDRATRTMTQEGYLSIGRVAGALGQRADRLLERLGSARREAVRRLFTARLVHLGDRPGSDTKRPARLDRLTAAELQVMDPFASEGRILVAGKSSVEIAHERLLGGWKTLDDWLREDREMLLWRQRVAYPLENSFILPWNTLREAQRWRRKRPEAFAAAESRRIDRSLSVVFAVLAVVVVSIGWLVSVALFGRWESGERRRLADAFLRHGGQASISLLEPRYPLRASDVAEVLAKTGRWDEVMAIEADFKESPQSFLTAVEPRLQTLAYDKRPYRRLAEVLWQLDYLAAKAEETGVREEAGLRGAELRSELRVAVEERTGNTPEPTGFLRIDPGQRALDCGSLPSNQASFCMGSEKVHPDERPVHPVKLDPYCLSAHEVTETEYGRFEPSVGGNTRRPVAFVQWFEAYAYSAWLGGRLPTEAEWEYAARAGEIADTNWFFGDDQSLLEQYAWFEGRASTSGGSLQPVGGLEPNPLGLYDMYGNVWEWVADFWSAYSPRLEVTPWGPRSGAQRMLRGGSFPEVASLVRSANRISRAPDYRYWDLGFRVLLPAPCDVSGAG